MVEGDQMRRTRWRWVDVSVVREVMGLRCEVPLDDSRNVC
jgi:hypothetical protein